MWLEIRDCLFSLADSCTVFSHHFSKLNWLGPVAIFSSEKPVASNGYDSCVIFRLDVSVSWFRVLEDRIWKAKNVTVSKHTLLDPLAIHHNIARMFIYTMLTILTCFPVRHFGGLKIHQYPHPPKDDLVCYPRQLWNFVVKVSNSVSLLGMMDCKVQQIFWSQNSSE